MCRPCRVELWDTAEWKSALLGGAGHLLCVQFIGKRVEVDIVRTPFQFAALKIHRIGTHRLFRRFESLAVIAVGSNAVLVEATEIEVANFVSLLGL